MKKSYHKLLLLIVLCTLSMINIKTVKADGCYKIVELPSYKLVEYTTDTSKYQNTSKYNVEPVNDSNCGIKKNNSNTGSVKNYDKNNVVSCGDGLLTDIPSMIPKTIHVIYLIIQIIVPILLVVFGSLDFLKSVSAPKDDEIKKGRQVFVKRVIAAVLVFFVFAIVKIVVSFAADGDKSRILDCASCIINNDENCIGG